MRLFSSSKDEVIEEVKKDREETIAEIVEMPTADDASGDDTSEVFDITSDSLLAQIDEFRKKAEALQNLINDRQEKYNELSATLKESEDRYALLQSEVSLKSESMNGIIDAVSEKLDIFADRIDTSVSNTVAESISSVKEEMGTELGTISKSVSSVSESIGDSLSSNLTGTINDAVKSSNEPVIEKIHSENVRLYRNLYDFVKEDYSMDTIKEIVNASVKKNRGPIGICLFLSIVNTVILVCLILLQLGIISF